MYIFYADGGYVEYPNKITNVSDIKFVDFNQPLNVIMETTTAAGGTGYRAEESAVYSFVESKIGTDVNRIYGTPSLVSGRYRDVSTYGPIYDSAIPSTKLSFPNLQKLATENVNPSPNLYACYYLKSLKRVIVFPSSSGSSTKGIYSVDDLGNLKLVYGNAPYYLWYLNIGSGGPRKVTLNACLKSDFNGDFSDISNYQRYIQVWSEPPINGGLWSSFTNFTSGELNSLKSEITSIFTTSSKPDETIPVNPYQPVKPSEEGELPPGTFDDTSDPIPDSPLPTLSAANTGFTRIYNPTLSQVQALARYLWTDESVVQTIWNKIKQYFEDPMQAILGFNLVPVPVPDGGQEEFALMYIPTGVTMTVAANQFVDVDCGTLVLDRYYGSALDQSPYTKIHAFLPFIGTVRLNTDEVMGTTLSVKYRVDIVSGSCVAKIFVDGNCLYQYSGHCAITIPISSADFSTYVSAAINVAKSLAPAVAAEVGAAMAPMSVPDIMIGTGVSGGLMPSQGAPLADYYPPIGPTSPISAPAGTQDYILGNMTPKDIANTVSQVNSGKPYIQHSGAFSGNSGYLGIRRPFLIIERPNMCLPENYQALNGFPSMITLKLGDCSGYTRIQQVQLTGMTATNVEQSEIMGLLKGGVVL